MPVRKRSNRRRQDITEEQDAWLEGDDENVGFFKYTDDNELHAFWDEHSERIVDEHIASYPGTRPAHWWFYDAPREPLETWPGCYYDGKLPIPRQRVGGSGTLAYEVQAYAPSYWLGIPRPWLSIDGSNPPAYESQATYLKRLGLLLPGELRRLRAKDWEPETVTLN